MATKQKSISYETIHTKRIILHVGMTKQTMKTVRHWLDETISNFTKMKPGTPNAISDQRYEIRTFDDRRTPREILNYLLKYQKFPIRNTQIFLIIDVDTPEKELSNYCKCINQNDTDIRTIDAEQFNEDRNRIDDYEIYAKTHGICCIRIKRRKNKDHTLHKPTIRLHEYLRFTTHPILMDWNLWMNQLDLLDDNLKIAYIQTDKPTTHRKIPYIYDKQTGDTGQKALHNHFHKVADQFLHPYQTKIYEKLYWDEWRKQLTARILTETLPNIPTKTICQNENLLPGKTNMEYKDMTKDVILDENTVFLPKSKINPIPADTDKGTNFLKSFSNLFGTEPEQKKQLLSFLYTCINPTKQANAKTIGIYYTQQTQKNWKLLKNLLYSICHVISAKKAVHAISPEITIIHMKHSQNLQEIRNNCYNQILLYENPTDEQPVQYEYTLTDIENLYIPDELLNKYAANILSWLYQEIAINNIPKL